MINIITEQNIQITITNSLKILWNQYFVKQTHTIKEKKLLEPWHLQLWIGMHGKYKKFRTQYYSSTG